MHFPTITLFLATALAAPFGHRQHHRLHSSLSTRGTGPTSPINVASSSYLCNLNSTNVNVVHDLGFVGKIGDNTVYTWGDTLAGEGASFFMTSDSSSIGTDDPCSVVVTALVDGNHPAEFVPIEAKWGETNTADAMGGTNVVSTGPDSGMMFYLANHRPQGGDDYIVGAGIATVTMSGNVPTASRLAKNWWDASAGEPNYGDITAYGGEKYVWGLGHGSTDGAYSYLTRCLKTNLEDLNSWEYYNGQTGEWSTDRLYHATTDQALQWNEEEGAVWQVGQGQMIWSAYYNKIMFVYGMNFGNGDGTYSVLARTADRPRGPWSAATELYKVTPLQQKGLVYAMIANPYFDDTGKTLIVTVTNSPNVNQVTRVTFA